jgi:hypothetical protein
MSGPPRAVDLRDVAAMLLQVANRLDACGCGQITDLSCFEQTLPAALALSEILASSAMLLEHVVCAYNTPAVQAAYTTAPMRMAAEDAETFAEIGSERIKESLYSVHRFLAAITLRQPEAATPAQATRRHSVMHELTTLQRYGRSYHSP